MITITVMSDDDYDYAMNDACVFRIPTQFSFYFSGTPKAQSK